MRYLRTASLLPVLLVGGCDLVPRKNAPPPEKPAVAVLIDSAQVWRPLALAHLEDNVRHDTLLIQTTFGLDDGTYVMVASNVEETREGLRLVRYRPRPDSSADVIAVSKPGYDSRTMLPTFHRGPDAKAGLLVLANMGERDSWGQEVFLLKDDRFQELGFLDVAMPNWDQGDEGPVRRLMSIAPVSVVHGTADDLMISFQTDSVLLYDDQRGGRDLTLPAQRVHYNIRGGRAILLIDGNPTPAGGA